jgi:phenylalanine-4-hydroxylase
MFISVIHIDYSCAMHFTHTAGLVAVHTVAEALKDGRFYFAWLLRHEAFLRFDYDPDAVLSGKTDEYGFRE